MDMIGLDVLFDDRESVGVSNLREEVFKKFLDVGCADMPAVLRRPDEMIVELIDRMGGTAVTGCTRHIFMVSWSHSPPPQAEGNSAGLY